MDIRKYAQLARIGISDDEVVELESEIEGILEYVEQIQEAAGEETEKEVGDVHNIMREDSNPHKPGKFTQELLDEAPDSQGGYIKVKKIL